MRKNQYPTCRNIPFKSKQNRLPGRKKKGKKKAIYPLKQHKPKCQFLRTVIQHSSLKIETLLPDLLKHKFNTMLLI